MADKNCEKIHYIADNIWCCGAGTSADTEATTALISSQLELHRMATGKQPRTVTACTMLKRMLFRCAASPSPATAAPPYSCPALWSLAVRLRGWRPDPPNLPAGSICRYQGNVSAALVLGGVDCTGPSLYTVYPHGSTDSLPYVTMGSGSLAAMAIFESDFKSGMTLEEAKALVHSAIMAGINNDLGSGGSVDMMVINKDSYTPLRNYDRPNLRKFRMDYSFPRGTATVLSKTFTPLSSLVTIETETAAMQVG